MLNHKKILKLLNENGINPSDIYVTEEKFTFTFRLNEEIKLDEIKKYLFKNRYEIFSYKLYKLGYSYFNAGSITIIKRYVNKYKQQM